MQATIGCQTGRVFSSQKGMRLARPIFRCSSTDSDSRCAVHGDDFYVLANRVAIDHIGKVLASKYKVRESHRLGFGKHCTRAAVASYRIIVLGASEGRRFVQIELDTGHVELNLKSLSLFKS